MFGQKPDSVYASSGISFDFFSALGFEMAHFIRTFLQDHYEKTKDTPSRFFEFLLFAFCRQASV